MPARKEKGLEFWGWTWLETLWQDVRFGVRTLRKSITFTTVAAITLALVRLSTSFGPL